MVDTSAADRSSVLFCIISVLFIQFSCERSGSVFKNTASIFYLRLKASMLQNPTVVKKTTLVAGKPLKRTLILTCSY